MASLKKRICCAIHLKVLKGQISELNADYSLIFLLFILIHIRLTFTTECAVWWTFCIKCKIKLPPSTHPTVLDQAEATGSMRPMSLERVLCILLGTCFIYCLFLSYYTVVCIFIYSFIIPGYVILGTLLTLIRISSATN